MRILKKAFYSQFTPLVLGFMGVAFTFTLVAMGTKKDDTGTRAPIIRPFEYQGCEYLEVFSYVASMPQINVVHEGRCRNHTSNR